MLSKHGDCVLYFVLFDERQSQWTIIEFKYDFLWPNGNWMFFKHSIRVFGVFAPLTLIFSTNNLDNTLSKEF